VSRLNDDVLSGGVLLLVAVGYGIVALGIPAGDGEPGPSFMPLLLSVALAGLSAVIVVAGLRRSAAAPVAAPAAAAVAETGKHRLQRVIVTFEDWVELVIVTTGTTDRETEERLTDRPDHLIEFILSRPAHGRLIATHLS